MAEPKEDESVTNPNTPDPVEESGHRKGEKVTAKEQIISTLLLLHTRNQLRQDRLVPFDKQWSVLPHLAVKAVPHIA